MYKILMILTFCCFKAYVCFACGCSQKDVNILAKGPPIMIMQLAKFPVDVPWDQNQVAMANLRITRVQPVMYNQRYDYSLMGSGTSQRVKDSVQGLIS